MIADLSALNPRWNSGKMRSAWICSLVKIVRARTFSTRSAKERDANAMFQIADITYKTNNAVSFVFEKPSVVVLMTFVVDIPVITFSFFGYIMNVNI